jgi:hypothetical protein
MFKLFALIALLFFNVVDHTFAYGITPEHCDLIESKEIAHYHFKLDKSGNELTLFTEEGSYLSFFFEKKKENSLNIYRTNSKKLTCNRITLDPIKLCKTPDGYEPWTFILHNGQVSSVRSKTFILEVPENALQIINSKLCGKGKIKNTSNVYIKDSSIKGEESLLIDSGTHSLLVNNSTISGNPQIWGKLDMTWSKILNSVSMKGEHLLRYAEVISGIYDGYGNFQGQIDGATILSGPNNFKGISFANSSLQNVRIETVPPAYVYVHPNTKSISDVTLRGTVTIAGSDLNLGGGATIEGLGTLFIREGTTITGTNTIVKATGLIKRSTITNGSSLNFYYQQEGCINGSNIVNATISSGASLTGCLRVFEEVPQYYYSFDSDLTGQIFCMQGNCNVGPLPTSYSF